MKENIQKKRIWRKLKLEKRRNKMSKTGKEIEWNR